MKRFNPFFAVIIFAVVSAISGCAIGYDRALFVTKTNVGFEASSKPPTIALDISRLEGVVAPQFANGKKLPVMASFRFENSNAFAPSVGSAFATGDAATTMSALYAERTPYNDWIERIKKVNGKNPAEEFPTDSTLTLNQEPLISWLPTWLSWLEVVIPKPKFQENDVRPVFFGTDTTLGLKVAWSGMTGGFPDSAKFGYNRKELALVPVAMLKETKNNIHSYKMKMSSLIATVDLGLKNPDGTPVLDYHHIQYFATGDAATLLAMQQDVRMAMLAKLDPNKELLKARFLTHLDGRGKTVAFTLLGPLYNELIKPEYEKDPMIKILVDRMDTLEPPGLKIDFAKYMYAKGNLSKDPEQTLSGKPFQKVRTYYSLLGNSIKQLEKALKDLTIEDISIQLDGKAVVDKAKTKEDLYKELEKLRKTKIEFEQAVISPNEKILSDVVDYFYH